MNIGYARVSGLSQDLDLQVAALEKHGCEMMFQGKHSGKAEANQSALDKMLSVVRKDDVVVVTKLDRLGRSMSQIIRTIELITEAGASLKCLDQAIDTTKDDALSNAMIQLMAMFAEMERTLITERLDAGKAATGNYGGRKHKLSAFDRDVIREQLTKGVSKVKLAKKWNVSRATIGNIEKE